MHQETSSQLSSFLPSTKHVVLMMASQMAASSTLEVNELKAMPSTDMHKYNVSSGREYCIAVLGCDSEML